MKPCRKKKHLYRAKCELPEIEIKVSSGFPRSPKRLSLPSQSTTKRILMVCLGRTCVTLEAPCKPSSTPKPKPNDRRPGVTCA